MQTNQGVLKWPPILGPGSRVSALEEALARFGRPEIFNTDKRE